MIVPTYPVAKIRYELACAQKTGNHSLQSSSLTRLAIADGDPVKIQAAILDNHGIRLECSTHPMGVALTFGRFSHHSFSTVHRVVRGAFKAASAMNEQGETILIIIT